MKPLDTCAVLNYPHQERRRLYVGYVLALYRVTPGTSGLARPADKKLANLLFDLDVPLDIVHAALIIGLARRLDRPHLLPPLAPIATLHYFRPIVDELLAKPPSQQALDDIRYRHHARAPALLNARTVDHQLP